MKNIIITATAESVEQAQALIDAGVDRIYVGEKDYGLRLPQTLSYDEINRIAQLVHAAGKELTVAVNALMHQSMMDSIKPFLDFLKDSKPSMMHQPWSLLAARSISGENKQELLRLFWLVRFHLPNYS